MVRTYQGADGLKTGFTDAAMYCMAVTAKREGMRLIAIVLGEQVSKTRNAETTALLDYGFNTYQVDIIKTKDTVVDELKIDRGNVDKADVVVGEEISILRKKNEQAKEYQEKIVLSPVKLPLKKGDVVGKIELYDQEQLVGSYDLMVNQDVDKKKFLSMLWNNLKDIVVGQLVF